MQNFNTKSKELNSTTAMTISSVKDLVTANTLK